MIKFKEYLEERIGPAAVKAKRMGLVWYGFGRWGRKGTITHIQHGTNILEPVEKPEIISDVEHKQLTKKVSTYDKNFNKKRWKELGLGTQSAVFDDTEDPEADYVIKVSGAGAGDGKDYDTDLAWIHFLIDHGASSKHFPNILDVNTDLPSAIQIKTERLNPIEDKFIKLGDYMFNFAIDAKSDILHSPERKISQTTINIFKKHLKKYPKFAAANSAEDLADALTILISKGRTYREQYGAHNTDGLDLHPGNWMYRDDYSIVINDPWYGG